MEGNEDSLNKSSLIAIVMVSTDSSPLSFGVLLPLTSLGFICQYNLENLVRCIMQQFWG